MKLRASFYMLIALSIAATPACAPRNTIKAKQFDAQSHFVETLSADLIASPDEIAKALGFSGFEASSKPELAQKLSQLNEKLNDPAVLPEEDFLNTVDQNFKASKTSSGLVLEGLRNEIRPLVTGVLYQGLFSLDESVKIPAVTVRKHIVPQDDSSNGRLKAIVAKLQNKRISFRATRIYGKGTLVQIDHIPTKIDVGVGTLAQTREVLAHGVINDSGKLEATNTLKELKVDSVGIANADTLIESQLLNEILTLELYEGDTLIGNVKFSPVGLQLTNENIEKIKTSLKGN